MVKSEDRRKRQRVQLGPPSHGFVLFIRWDRGSFMLEEDDLLSGVTRSISVTDHEAFNLIDYLKEQLKIE